MTQDEAKRLVGNQPPTCLKNMAIALSLMPRWLNNEDDWRRLQAAVMVLGRSAPKIARMALRVNRQWPDRPGAP